VITHCYIVCKAVHGQPSSNVPPYNKLFVDLIAPRIPLAREKGRGKMEEQKRKRDDGRGEREKGNWKWKREDFAHFGFIL